MRRGHSYSIRDHLLLGPAVSTPSTALAEGGETIEAALHVLHRTINETVCGEGRAQITCGDLPPKWVPVVFIVFWLAIALFGFIFYLKHVGSAAT
jgi:hypothetical protein